MAFSRFKGKAVVPLTLLQSRAHIICDTWHFYIIVKNEPVFTGLHKYPLQLHLFSQVTRRRLNELLLGVPGTVAFFVLQEHHAAAYIAGGDDRGLHQRIIGNALNGL